MSATIKISDDHFYRVVKDTAKTQTRSIGDQSLHWMKIGKAIEESVRFDYKKVTAALEGKILYDDLSAEEQIIHSVNFDEIMCGDMSEQFTKHFSELDEVDKLYGINDNGDITSG
jgi:hypothetical protein